MARRQARHGAAAQDEVVKEESSWRYPLTIAAITAVLSAFVLYAYLGPGVEDLQGETLRPTTSDEPVAVTIGDLSLAVPASYLLLPKDRRPGERDSLPIAASWPSMNGYRPSRDDDFTQNRPDTRRIDLVVEEKRAPFTEAERIDVLYLPQTVDRRGTPGTEELEGLTRYAFRKGAEGRPASGYADKEMFVGVDEDGGPVVILCYEEVASAVLPADCYRQYDATDQVAVKYQFKRAFLPEWRRIDERSRALIDALAAGPDD